MTVINRRDCLVYFSLALFLALILTLRRVDAVTTPQFWNEDGAIVFRNSLLFSFSDNIFSNIYNFPYLLPKLIGQFALPFGYEAAPLVYSLVANCCAGLLAATFSLPFFKHVINSDFLRIFFCVLVVSLPNMEELTSSPVNLSWHIAIWCIPAAFMILPRSWWAINGLSLVYFVCIYSSPSSIIIAPIWLVRLARGALRHNRQEIAMALVILSTIASIFLLTGDLGSSPHKTDASFNLLAMTNILTSRLISDVIVGRQVNLLLGKQVGLSIGYLLIVLLLLGLLLLSAHIRYKNALFSVVLFGIVVGQLFLAFMGRPVLNQVGTNPSEALTYGAGRYFIVGNALICLIILLSLDRLRPSRYKSGLVAIVLFLMVGVVVQTFAIPVRTDDTWPSYARKIPAALASDTAPPLLIPILPDKDSVYWYIKINEDITPADVKITPVAALPELTGATEYSQSFNSECNRLNSVSLYVTKGNKTATTPVLFELRDVLTQAIIVKQAFSAEPLADNSWQTIYFHPVDNSTGRVYRFYLASPGAQAQEGITIYRSTSDQYTRGEAYQNNQNIQADMVFKYTCRPVPKIDTYNP